MNLPVIYKHGKGQHFEIITYPDGQRTVQLDMEYFNNPKVPIEIRCSIRNYSELEVYHCLYMALIKNDFIINKIKLNYLFGMRSDRAFNIGEPNYFRDIVAPHFHNFHRPICILHPHSMISIKAIPNAIPESAVISDEKDYYMIGADESACWDEHWDRLDCLHGKPYFYKKRYPDKIIVMPNEKFRCDIKTLPEHKPLLIKDDLCDAGGSFIAIAEYLEENYPDRERHLFVAHGLFTKGVDHVAQHYDKVITTNSYQEFEPHPKLEIIDVWT